MSEALLLEAEKQAAKLAAGRKAIEEKAVQQQACGHGKPLLQPPNNLRYEKSNTKVEKTYPPPRKKLVNQPLPKWKGEPLNLNRWQ